MVTKVGHSELSAGNGGRKKNDSARQCPKGERQRRQCPKEDDSQRQRATATQIRDDRTRQWATGRPAVAGLPNADATQEHDSDSLPWQ